MYLAKSLDISVESFFLYVPNDTLQLQTDTRSPDLHQA